MRFSCLCFVCEVVVLLPFLVSVDALPLWATPPAVYIALFSLSLSLSITIQAPAAFYGISLPVYLAYLVFLDCILSI